MSRNVLTRGLTAGAAGTTALNAVTYLDMAVRARPTSDLPERTVEELTNRAGFRVPGEGEQHDNRVQGLAALSGTATGLAIGVVAGVLGPLWRRLPLPAAALGLGALAMAATDSSMARLGLTDPSSWGAADWLSDAVPHVAYGLATAWTLGMMDDG